MNRLSNTIKSERKWLMLFAFLAACNLFIPALGSFAILISVTNIIVLPFLLLKMYNGEKKEFNPRENFREICLTYASKTGKLQNVANKSKSGRIPYRDPNHQRLEKEWV